MPHGTYFPVSCVDSKYLASPLVLLTWTCDLPLVSEGNSHGPLLKAAEHAARSGPMPCNSQASRSPATLYWFSPPPSPPISWRGAQKRLKTLSVWSWIRILHRGDTSERGRGSQQRFRYLVIGLTLYWPEILLSARRMLEYRYYLISALIISNEHGRHLHQALGHAENNNLIWR